MYDIQLPDPCPVCRNDAFDLAPNVINARTIQYVHPGLLKWLYRRLRRHPVYDSITDNVHIIDGYICKKCGFTSFYSRAILERIYSPEE